MTSDFWLGCFSPVAGIQFFESNDGFAALIGIVKVSVPLPGFSFLKASFHKFDVQAPILTVSVPLPGFSFLKGGFVGGRIADFIVSVPLPGFSFLKGFPPGWLDVD